MTLLYRPSNKLYDIYDIKYDSSGYPQFLIYCDGKWELKSAKHFTPNYVEDGYGKIVAFD